MRRRHPAALRPAARRDLRAFVTTAAALVLFLIVGLGDSFRTVKAGPQPDAAPAQSEPPLQTDAEELRGREQRILRQVIYRDRQAQATLDRAEAALRGGDSRRAIELLQQIFDQRGDHFVWVEAEQRLASARHRAQQLLSSCNAKTREMYEWAYGDEANRLFELGRSTGDPALISDVSRRFFHTMPGFVATDWLATRWLDRGEYGLAVKSWGLLAADPRHRLRINEAIRRKADLAQRLLARAARRTPPIRLNSPDVQTADLTSLDDSSEADLRSSGNRVVTTAARVAIPEPTSVREDLDQSRSPIPWMKPNWRMPLAGEKSAVIGNAISRWELAQQHEDKRPVAVHSVIAAGPAVAFRSYDGICAVDSANGRLLWKYATGTCLAHAATESNSPARNGGSSSEERLDTVLTSYAGNSILGTLTTDGTRIYAIDSMEVCLRRAEQPSEDTGGLRNDPENAVRAANRLVALDVFDPRRADDGSVKPAWSVGGSLGTRNWFYRMDADDDGRVTRAEFLGSPEEFRKLDRNGDGAIDLSEAENPEASIERHPLDGHFFLGPPLAFDGRLYVVTECDCQLNLVALSADTGAVLWIQGVGYVDRPIDEDPARYALACTPCCAGGIIVCPTQVGVLVGVDALDGALVWTYYYGDEDVSSPDSGWSFFSHRCLGNTGFPSQPVIEDNRIVVLPRQSEWIHCVDLSSGRGIWKKPRNDSEFIAATANGVVMVVGDRFCRGLSLANGAERWCSRLGEISGCGTRIGKDYLLPLAESRIAAIDIATGARHGSAMDPDQDEINAVGDDEAVQEIEHTDRPGNLTASGGSVLSISAREIVAYPRAAVLRDEVQSRMASGSRHFEMQFLAAQLEMTLEDVAAAREQLARLSGSELAPADRDRVERLTRAVLYKRLQQMPADAAAVLEELDQLSRTPRERGRFLRSKALADVRRGDLQGVLDSSAAYAALPIHGLVAIDSNRQMSPRSCLASTDDQLRQHFDAGARSHVAPRVAALQRAALASADRAVLERFLAVYPSWPEADAVRQRLARILADSGYVQQAELLLIRNSRSPRSETADAANCELAHLLERAGLSQEAAELVFESGKVTAAGVQRRAKPAPDIVGKPMIDRFNPRSLTRMAYRRLEEASRLGGQVRVRQSLWQYCDSELADTYINAARPFVTRATSTFQLIDRGAATRAEISVVDLICGTVIGTLHVPSPYSGSSLIPVTQVGHFIPLGSHGALHGVSLLQPDSDRPLWTTSPRSIAHDEGQVLVGPSGPTFSAFQSHRHLFVVDPGTGKVIWQRSDLDPQSGLAGDPVRGIFGDDEVLVVFAADHLGYTVYRTATGEELREGRLDSDARYAHERRAIGRCLAHFTADDPVRRMRIWDPLTDRLVYDRPISERNLWKETGEDEIAVVTADDLLQIVDGHTGAIRVSTHLDPEELRNACQLAVFQDDGRYYVNLQPVQSLPEPERYSFCFGGDTYLPRVDLRGSLLAIDRRTGERLWKRSFPQRTVVRVPSLHLSLLVMLSTVGDRINSNHRSMLVEVVDGATGETLGCEDNNLCDRILRLTYDQDHHRLQLWGTKSVVDLDFTRTPAQLSASWPRSGARF